MQGGTNFSRIFSFWTKLAQPTWAAGLWRAPGARPQLGPGPWKRRAGAAPPPARILTVRLIRR